MRELTVLACALFLAACGSGESARPALPTGTALATLSATVGGVPLVVEIADTAAAQEAGLRGRPGVPVGTGMVFRFSPARDAVFTMAGVTYPLVAVFAAGDRVVAVRQMAPCAGAVAACPTYSAGVGVDAVVEAAPASLPQVAVGDVVSLG